MSTSKTPLAMVATLDGIASLRIVLGATGAGVNGVEVCGGAA